MSKSLSFHRSYIIWATGFAKTKSFNLHIWSLMHRPAESIKEEWRLESFCPVQWRIKFFMLLSNFCQHIKQIHPRKFWVEARIQARPPLCNCKKIHASWTELTGKGQMFARGGGRVCGEEGGNCNSLRSVLAFKTIFSLRKYKLCSIPQMVTLSTSKVFRYVFSRGNYQVPKFLMQIMSRMHLRMGQLLYTPVIRGLAQELPPLLEASQNFLSPHKKAHKTGQRHFLSLL